MTTADKDRTVSGTASGLLDRALGSFLGLAVGDALGATVEFMTAQEISARYETHRELLGGGWLRLAPGAVTDDTQMALALSSALLASGGWNLPAIAEAFADWLRSGPLDVGNTCRRGISHYIATGNLCAPPAETSCGNGALMRNLPTVLISLQDEQRLTQRSIEQAHITHNHPLADAATAALGCLTRRLLLEGPRAPGGELAAGLVARHPQFQFTPWPGKSGGFVVETVQTVLDGFFSTDNFEDCLVRVVNRGGDADTTGAVAGQLAGARYGASAIPTRWLNRLDPAVAAEIRRQTPLLLELSGPVTPRPS